jgi:hypothetical protein
MAAIVIPSTIREEGEDLQSGDSKKRDTVVIEFGGDFLEFRYIYISKWWIAGIDEVVESLEKSPFLILIFNLPPPKTENKK